MEKTRSLAALVRFQWATGVRLSLRAMAPMMAVVVAAIGLQDNPGVALASFCIRIAGAGFDPFIAACELLVAGMITSWAGPRLPSAEGSWVRHLPASGSTHRLARTLGFVAVQIPLLLAVTLAALATIMSGGRVGFARIGFLLLIVPGLAWWAASGDTLGLRATGGLWAGGDTGLATSGRISARALGWRRLEPLLYGMLPLLGCLILLSNNQLEAESTGRVVRFSAVLSVCLAVAGLAEKLGWLRPVWPWARSLPWSSRQRIIADAWFLGAHTLPLLLVALLVNWRGALAALLVTPFLSVRGAGLIRSALSSRAGASGRLMTEGFVIAGLTFLSSLAPWVVLAAVPWALRHASNSERDQRVTRWFELRHLAEGDPASWSGR